MDTSWIELPNNNPTYKEGVRKFVQLAAENLVEGKTRCPCKKCKVDKWLPLEDVEYHIMFHGFDKSYKNWLFHGKGDIFPRMLGSDERASNQPSRHNDSGVGNQDDMGGLFRAAFGVNFQEPSVETLNDMYGEPSSEEMEYANTPEFDSSLFEESNRLPNATLDEAEHAKFKRLLKASNEPLYEGCTSYSKLAFLLELFQLKVMHNWTDVSMTMLLEILGRAFPFIMEFPLSTYDAKKVINDLGLGYEKIDACPNNCMLYWGEHSNKEECHVCLSSRWKTCKGEVSDVNVQTTKQGEPVKVMRYFPLIPRLKRIYMSPKAAKDMRWHHKDHREIDGMLRHPSDGTAWKEFDKAYPDFSRDPRSVRLGLASDGFNPYRLMNTTYTTWPVVLMCYNLPPWLCMKTSSFILSSIIPGKSSPGNDIDVFLQPLLHELKLLWEGIDAFDAYKNEYFVLRATLTFTINDFPAYAMLSGWSTRGYKACPVCTTSTHSYRFANKICYLGHRKWLNENHPFRVQSELFDGTVEHGQAPSRSTGTEILQQLEGVSYAYGKAKKASKGKKKKNRIGSQTPISDKPCTSSQGNNGENVLWTKKSKFFDLPYWEHSLLRHNLDVMHIEKNVCDILLGTLLNMDKSRDDMNCRNALKELNIKSHLWPTLDKHQKLYIPPASYSMLDLEKERFLRVLEKIRSPDGYASNISRCVKLRKLSNLKSHDHHVLMQDILPVALRASKATQIVDLISKLSSFFKYLCSTTLDPSELDKAQTMIIETLCRMEMEFLPSFFTIMVHLIVHLVDEVKLGGPVQYRWMYPIERYLSHLKSYVKNKAQPEGSIAEGYVLEETMFFCSKFLEQMDAMSNRSKRNDDEVSDKSSYLFNSGGRPIGKVKDVCLNEISVKQVHRYVLLHTDEMKDLFNEFLRQKQAESEVRGQNAESEWLINEYPQWLQKQAQNIDTTTEDGKFKRNLVGGLSNFAKRMGGIVVNGYKFLTLDRERYRQTQNSGVMVEADGQAYYGKLRDIYELDYYGSSKLVVFRCDWVDINRGLKTYINGGVSVNFSKLMHTGRFLCDDPFVFSSQAIQVFYVEDEMQKGWFHVIKTKPRDLFDVGEDDS